VTVPPAPVIGVVVPVYDEEAGLRAFHARLAAALDGAALDWRVLYVDDGSRDGTWAIVRELTASDRRAGGVRLTRNFGKDLALSCGLELVEGDAVVPIDADLQDPPELIPALVARWREGDVALVDAVRRSRHADGWLKRASARAFYRVMGRLSRVPMRADLGDFRLLDRRAVEAFKRLPERTRFVKGLFAWIGMPRAEVAYDREARHAGSSRWSYWRLWNFALDGILSHSTVPLRVWTYGGAFIAATALVFAAYRVVRTLVLGVDVPGYASIMVAILFIGGVQILSIGVLGEYIGRIYEEVKRRPLYLVDETAGAVPPPTGVPPAERSPRG
jgi:glycosyltransferase involved in cell wall biosynthesis